MTVAFGNEQKLMYGSYFGSCIVSLGSVTEGLRVMALCAEHVQWLRDRLDGKSIGGEGREAEDKVGFSLKTRSGDDEKKDEALGINNPAHDAYANIRKSKQFRLFLKSNGAPQQATLSYIKARGNSGKVASLQDSFKKRMRAKNTKDSALGINVRIEGVG
ncbi:hypothetical protein ARMGADRAFT_1069531 [Armillaria gallica]|uniref:Uncharacterized protein n=1 Tax=Armillaria gallica TaxID=47427 RepID=A0A2H3C7U3_ARMGA|nr:hypothetical protein ARMGADRAFT_1069531 [Armillaria gallica]